AAALGAGLVISEMTASAALAQRRPKARVRAEGQGLRTHVVQLAGCEPTWMAEGARIAEASRAAIIDIHIGCPARPATRRPAGPRRAVWLGAEARARPCPVADRGDRRRGLGAGYAQDAARMGGSLPSIARNCPSRTNGRRAAG